MATNVTTHLRKINWVLLMNTLGIAAILIIMYFLYGVIRDTSHLSEENLVISIQHLNPGAAQRLLQDERARLVDVRTPIEWQLGNHIEGAISIPLYEFDERIISELPDKNAPIIVTSFSDDPRSLKAAEWLLEHGYTDVYHLDGGILGWASSGLPTSSFRQQLGYIPDE
jgi:rhodanese-related sulfurtransferase